MATATVTRGIASGGTSISTTESVTGSGRVELEETVANGQTDFEINFDLDVSACQCFIISSNYAVTVETNSGSAADDTITLVADRPYVYVSGDYNSFLLGTDVTSIFITNASGSAATIKVLALYDATP